MCSKRCRAQIRRLEMARRIDRFLISVLFFATTAVIGELFQGRFARGESFVLGLLMLASIAFTFFSGRALTDELVNELERCWKKWWSNRAATRQMVKND